MAVRPRTNGGKALQLACWNADGVRGRKLELKRFLSERGVDICLLNETHLQLGKGLRFANYVCHRTDRPNLAGVTATIARKGIAYAVPVSGLQHLETTAINLQLATRPVKLVAAYLLPTRPLIGSEITEWQSGGFPVLMASDLNAKQTDCNSRMIRARVWSCVTTPTETPAYLWAGLPTTAPYRHNATPHVLHSGCQGLRQTSTSVCLFCTQFVLLAYPDRHHMPIILSKPAGPPRLHANWVGCFPDFLWRLTPAGYPGKRRGGNRQVRRRADQRHSGSHGGTCSHASTPFLPAAPSKLQYSRWNTPEGSVKGVASQEGPHAESPGQPSPEVGVLSAERVRNGQWSDTMEALESEYQSLWKMTKRVMRVSTPSPRF
jgi:hypothetical protein